MAKKKNMKADKPMFTGRIMFDGNIQVRIPQHGIKTLRTDLAGMKLREADPNKELLVFTTHFTGYNEIHTGYIVRMKRYDDMEQPCFGLKHEPDADSWSIINYCDVIAWGYADGGLNDPTLFYSCQSTVEEEADRERRRAEKGIKTHAEKLAELEAEMEAQHPQGMVIKYRHKDGNIESETSWPNMSKEYVDKMQDYLKPTLETYLNFNEDHPEVKEMHFYTEYTVWEKDLEEEE